MIYLLKFLALDLLYYFFVLQFRYGQQIFQPLRRFRGDFHQHV